MSADLLLDGVSFAHPGSGEYAVRDLTLSVSAGSMVALLGSSGSGKSTVLRLAAGLATPGSGAVRLGGRSLAGVAPQNRGMTMMFQKPLLFPHLSVLDNVAFADRIAGRSRREARANAGRFLDLVHLGDLAGRRSRELSGGQEQRVALARALAATPKVLLLDEPFGALDTAVRESMHELLEEVRALLDPTIVLVTHDLTEAALADDVAVLGHGSVVQRGTVAALHAGPASLHVARLLGGYSEWPGQVRGGVHRGPAGEVVLPGACGVGDGPATLLLHRHSVRISFPGAHPAPERSPVGGLEQSLPGLVVRSRSTGLRQRVSVAVGPESRHAGAGTGPQHEAPILEAEVTHPAPGGATAAVGDQVLVHLAERGVWAISGGGVGVGQEPVAGDRIAAGRPPQPA